MTTPHVLISGGGIAGLALGLTLHQIGVPFTIFERVKDMRPLGVGINVQPNAVRELFDLGITAQDLDGAGVPAQEWAMVGRNGHEIYAETRGTFAGYHWPQYALHRGRFHMMLARILIERAGPEVLQLGCEVTGYAQTPTGVRADIQHADGTHSHADGTLLIASDGIHSKLRAQMHPDQPPIHWGGAIMWRGTTQAKPLRTGSSFVGLGSSTQRMVIYPISPPDPDTGLCEVNWIAEITVEDTKRDDIGWFRQVEVDDFAHHFNDWVFDWLDVPSLLRGATEVYENPMIDRDPVHTWHSGAIALMGDAAHAMYPTGSNGASQAIVDARVLGAAMLEHGVTPAALAAYNETLCAPVSELILRNRGAGPFGLLTLVEDRCGGEFDDIDTVVSKSERDAFMAGYKSAAGFARDTLNAAPSHIPKGARLQM